MEMSEQYVVRAVSYKHVRTVHSLTAVSPAFRTSGLCDVQLNGTFSFNDFGTFFCD